MIRIIAQLNAINNTLIKLCTVGVGTKQLKKYALAFDVFFIFVTFSAQKCKFLEFFGSDFSNLENLDAKN